VVHVAVATPLCTCNKSANINYIFQIDDNDTHYRITGVTASISTIVTKAKFSQAVHNNVVTITLFPTQTIKFPTMEEFSLVGNLQLMCRRNSVRQHS